jgi:O-antigen/teichoic acid export membrane protein
MAGGEADLRPAQLGSRAAIGVLGMLIYSGSNKAITFLGQVALAWFLVPADIGMVATALSLASIVGIANSPGLKDVLVRERQSFDSLASKAFWLSLFLNTVGAIGLVIVAFAWASVTGDHRIIPLILVIAATWPIQALGIVYSAKLSQELAFGAIGRIQLFGGVVYTTSAILLAHSHPGPMALILPLLWQNAAVVFALRLRAGSLSLARPSTEGWWKLMAPNAWLVLNSLASSLQNFGPVLVISLLHDPAITGVYYWGYQLSTQVAFLLSSSLRQVLFPNLALLDSEPARLASAVRRASIVVMTLIAPVCFLQAILAEPVIQWIFPDRWSGAATVMECLSVGLLTNAIGALGLALISARGRFRALAVNNLCCALVVIGAAWLGTGESDPLRLSAFIACGLLLCGFATYLHATLEFGSKSGMGTLARIIAISLASFAGAEWLHNATAPGSAVMAAAFFSITYACALALLAPEAIRICWQTFRSLRTALPS